MHEPYDSTQINTVIDQPLAIKKIGKDLFITNN